MPESLYALALLACPLGMGAMMWMMMRGSNKPSEADGAATRAELSELRAQVNHLKATKTEGQRPEARNLRS